MNQYTIYCTPSQTKKALELGAPIEMSPYFPEVIQAFVLGENMYHFPTAEQMINWIEGQDEIKSVVINVTDEWQFEIWGSDGTIIWYKTGFDSRKEATIAAIDAALEYLENLKQ